MAEGGAPSFWPDGLVRSYWNYDALQQARDIPFMGYDFNNRFTLALLAGAAVIVLFAIRRFNTKSYSLDSFGYRVLQELVPMKLRRAELMRRAYTRYAMALLVIYLALTLFGKLIIETLNSLPVAGLQVDASSFDFNSPNWPLLVSFGMIGLAPMLPFVEAAENRIRAWSHKAAGIPVQIAELTNRVKRGLDTLAECRLDRRSLPELDDEFMLGQAGFRQTADADPAMTVKASRKAPDWLAKKVSNPQAVERAFRTRMQLQWLVDWSRAENAYWPAAEVRSMLLALESKEVIEAEQVLGDFKALLMEDFDHASGAGDKALPESDRLDAHRRRLERNWYQITMRMAELRDELAAIQVIYAEHDPALGKIEDPGLEWIMKSAMSDRYSDDGPEYWILLLLLPIFGLYLFAIDEMAHPLFSDVSRTWLTKAVTAGLETARVAVLFLIPLQVAMSMRHFMLERSHNPWRPVLISEFDKTRMRQLVQVGAIGAAVAAVGLGLLAFFWVALLSATPARLQELVFADGRVWLQFYMSQAMISFIYVIAVIVAVDAVRFGKTAFRQVVAGIAGGLGAIGVAWIWSLHLGFWIGFNGECASDGLAEFWVTMTGDFWQQDSCYTRVAATNMFLYATLTLLSATLFLSWRKRKKPSDDEIDPEEAQVNHPVTDGSENQDRDDTSRVTSMRFRRGSAVLLAVGLAAGSAGDVRAADPVTVTATGAGGGPVRVGIRTDVEPFAYRVDLASGPEYLGYMAKFCELVFPPGGAFKLEFVEVNATNRFDSFRRDWSKATGQPEDSRGEVPPVSDVSPEIDVLCDPSTLRFSADDGREEGVFSPPVFISGVSFIKRQFRGQRGASVILGYVAGSTAQETALQACRGNLFKITPEPLPGSCDDQLKARNFENCYPAPPTEGDTKTYLFCELPDHRTAIEWFCARSYPDREIQGAFQYERAYIGDRDIVIGKYESFRRIDPYCRAFTETNFETYTYEPYALIIRRDRTDLIQYVQRRVYEIFSNQPLVEGVFSSAFSQNGAIKGMTRALASLFLLNAVERTSQFSQGGADWDGAAE